MDGEILPCGTFRTFKSFLIKECQTVPPLKMEIVWTEIEYLKEHGVIASFIDLG